MPGSKKLWLQAAKKEGDAYPDNPAKKKAILLKALEHLPNDLQIWKEAISLEETEGAKQLLSKAVQCVPHATELWLALAKLETYERAKEVLNDAIEAIPTDHSIWVSAAKLEEAQGNTAKVFDIIRRAFKKLTKGQIKIPRDHWLKETVDAEKGKSLTCSQAIVKELLSYGMPD